MAASKNYVEILSELLPLLSGDELNAQDIDGWTALHAAAHWGHREACMILIEHGADLDIRTRAVSHGFGYFLWLSFGIWDYFGVIFGARYRLWVMAICEILI